MNRILKIGFFILVITAAIARWQDADDRIEMFCVITLMAMFFLWVVVGYVRAWSVALGKLKKPTVAGPAGYREDDYLDDVPRPHHADVALPRLKPPQSSRHRQF